MPTGDAYSSGHLVPSLWDLHMFYLLRPIFFNLSLLYRTMLFEYPSVLSRFVFLRFCSSISWFTCPPWCYIVGATVTVHQFFCIFHCCYYYQQKTSMHSIVKFSIVRDTYGTVYKFLINILFFFVDVRCIGGRCEASKTRVACCNTPVKECCFFIFKTSSLCHRRIN